MPTDERIAVSLFSLDLHNSFTEDIRTKGVLKSLTSPNEFSLDNVDSLPDEDYSISLFKDIPYAANFVFEGKPAPIYKSKPLLRYMDYGSNRTQADE